MSLSALDRSASSITLSCTAVCGCAVSFVFSAGECSKLANFTMKAGEVKAVPVCHSARWDEGVVVAGVVSVAKLGQSVVLFEADSRVQVDGERVFTPLPGTTLVANGPAFNKGQLSRVRTKVVTFRQTNIRDHTAKVQPNLTSVYAIAFANDGSACPVRPPICGEAKPVDFDDAALRERLGELSGLDDLGALPDVTTVLPPLTAPTVLTPLPTPAASLPPITTGTLPPVTPPVRRRQAGAATPSNSNTLSSCYLLQKEQFAIEYQLSSAIAWGRVIAEFGGAYGTAFMFGGWIALCASWIGLRKGAQKRQSKTDS